VSWGSMVFPIRTKRWFASAGHPAFAYRAELRTAAGNAARLQEKFAGGRRPRQEDVPRGCAIVKTHMKEAANRGGLSRIIPGVWF